MWTLLGAIEGTTEGASLLSWNDVLKLCIPFAFALFLIWAKHAFERGREREAKGEYLWRSIVDAAKNLPLALEALDAIAVAYTNNRIRVVDFDIPKNLAEFANRLSELEPENATVYSDYSSQIAIVDKGLGSLKTLSLTFLTASHETRPFVVKALAAQTKSTKRDLITLGNIESQVLCLLHRANPSKYTCAELSNHAEVMKAVNTALVPEKAS